MLIPNGEREKLRIRSTDEIDFASTDPRVNRGEWRTIRRPHCIIILKINSSILILLTKQTFLFLRNFIFKQPKFNVEHIPIGPFIVAQYLII